MYFFINIIFFLVLKSDFSSAECVDKDYDYIVVGGGATGSVVATRLSEDADVEVLLLEAGGEPPEKTNIPLLAFESVGTEIDWNYTSTRQEHCCNLNVGKTLPYVRGKVLGGTGTLNSMAYTRGNRKDFDSWEKLGNPGWNYSAVMPYFLKLEDYDLPYRKEDAKYHSRGGPITVSIPSFKTPMAYAFLDAGTEIGQPLVDYNARTQTGFMYPPVTLKNGSRCSSYTCYLKPAMKRPNLDVVTYALTTKIVLNNHKIATGVEYTRKSTKCKVNARKEVIVSGGVFNSPQLLMLSGIGPKKTLEKFKIPVVADLPGVGQNLQDHQSVGWQMYTLNKKVSYNARRYRTKKYLDQWYANKTGPMTCPEAFEGIAFYQSKLVKDVTDYPDIEVYFNTNNLLRSLQKYINPLYLLFLPGPTRELISFAPYILRPKSRGYVTLRSKNPHDHPIINPNFLSHSDDITTLVEGVKFVRKLAATKAFQKYGASLVVRGFLPDCALLVIWSDAYLRCIVKVLLGTMHHPTSTCKMGPKSDHMSVVDYRLRVHGITGLRIADASIMPNIVSAHPTATCQMIGEKVSDMIKQDNQ